MSELSVYEILENARINLNGIRGEILSGMASMRLEIAIEQIETCIRKLDEEE